MKGFGGLLLLASVISAIVRYAAWIGLVIELAALLGAMWLLASWLDSRIEAWERKRTARRAAAAGIARRADDQHALYLAGDERGIYGEYQPFHGQP